MKIKSSAFENNQNIPSKYTCDGQDINPPLEFLGVPKEAKTLALIVDDPDAPNGNWDHWIVFNIAASIKTIEEGKASKGATEIRNDFGKTSYGGPCPPSEKHRYFFKLYALDSKLELDFSARKKDLLEAMEGHILDKAELIGLYQRG